MRKNFKLNIELVVVLVRESNGQLLSCEPELKQAVSTFVVSSRYVEAFQNLM